jgi:hypothetical protein
MVAFTCGHAQQPDKAKKDEDLAQIRFWNMCPPDSPDLNLIIRSGEKPLIMGIRWQEASQYFQVDPKKYDLIVQNAETQKSEGEVKIDVDKQTYFTVLVTMDGNKRVISVIDDTYTYVPAGPGTATLHQFVPGLTADVTGPDGSRKTIRYGEKVVFSNLPKAAEIQLDCTKADGKKYTSTVQLGFDIGNHVAALIMLDRYKRVNARSYYSGYIYAVDDIPVEAAPTSAP